MAEQRDREFVFSDANFSQIRQFVTENTGIVLTDAKKDMVYSRLSKRIRKGPYNNFDDFCQAIERGDADEQDFLINAITTNLTAFFRENHHFEFLAEVAIPELLKLNQPTKRIRIWSAGCSTGEEPYSIAMVLRETIPNIQDWDVKILATDLDANVIAHGQAGVYREERIEGLSPERKRRWFKKGKGDKEGYVKVSRELQQLISFKRLNLLQHWPMSGPFDLMFCRNVVIYFDKDTQRVLFKRYFDILRPNAYLLIGHSETLHKVSDDFTSLGKTIYQRSSR
jgi:chemotaxis protein methyltransferase CheR